MAAPLQWQPAFGNDPEEPIYFQPLPLYLPNSNLDPRYGNFNTIPSSNLEPLYEYMNTVPSSGLKPLCGNFDTAPSSGINGGSLEGYQSQMISDRIELVPDALPVTGTIPLSTADMLSVSQKVPTSEDWDFYRSTIIQLYRDEDRKLKDVMQIMRTRHHFHATVKMYKSRLTAWDVRKYMTRAEREVACRVMKLKKRAGGASGKVIVRGKERNLDVFLRHMGQSRAGIQRRQLLQSTKHIEDIIIDSVKINQVHSQVWPTMYPAGPERNVEIICTETLSLFMSSMVPGLVPPPEFAHFLLAAHDRFHTNRLADVRVLLNRAATWFFKIVCTQPVKAVLALFQILTIRHSEGLYASDLLACFHCHLLDVVRERYGPQHSLAKLLAQIFQIEDNVDTKQQVYQGTFTAIISNLSQKDEVYLSDWYRNLARSFEISGQHQKAEELLLKNVSSLNGKIHCEDDGWLRRTFRLAWHYIIYRPDMHDEADRMLNDILEAITQGDTGELDPRYAYLAYQGLGCLAEWRGKEDMAINFYHLYIQAVFEAWGPDAPEGLRAVSDLEDYLRWLGREEEAVKVGSLINLTDEFSGHELG